MTREEVIARIRDRAGDIRSLGATALYLFGSAARDELRDDSDVDVFIDRESEFDLLQLAGLQLLLEEELGREVDLATRGALRGRLRNEIEKSAVRVF